MREPRTKAEREIDRQVEANFADRELRARIRAELRGQVSAWGLPLTEAAELLDGAAQACRAEAEASRRSGRGRR